MTLQDALRQYLDESGESMRALSLRAGLNPKAISDILTLPGLRPRHTTLVALSTATGKDLHACLQDQPLRYADLLRRLADDGKKSAASRIRWLLRQAGWVAEVEVVCKHAVADFFAQHNEKTFDLTSGSLETYKSQIFGVLGCSAQRRRPRGISDIGGLYAEIHAALKESTLKRSQTLVAGSFLVFLDDRCISPDQVSTEVLAAYYVHRLEVSTKGEKACRKHVDQIVALLSALAAHPDLRRFGFTAVASPFPDGRNKFGVETASIAPLMEEFDTRVAPWALGHTSRDNICREQFIECRIQRTIDLTDILVSEINAEIARRRKSYRKKKGVLPELKEVIDLELARDIMAALAHDIMLARAPRSNNLIGIRLDWIAFPDSCARITIPAAQVKGRRADDAALPIPLGEQTSRLLRMYIEQVRPLALDPRDRENPFLFPSQDHRTFRSGRPYAGILKRVVRQLKREVGVSIHPHLYRHLIGWIWLKESLDNIPKVQKLLGHKSLQTTMRYYADIDETLALQEWQTHLNRKRAG